MANELFIKEIDYMCNSKKALIYNLICPVNKWKTNYHGRTFTSSEWKNSKLIIQNFLTPWFPDDKEKRYKFNYLVPEKDRKDIDSGLKFSMDILSKYWYRDDRQVKEVAIKLHKDPNYYILLEVMK